MAVFPVPEAEAVSPKKHNLQECGLYFESEHSFEPTGMGRDCDFAGGTSDIASYIWATKDMVSIFEKTEGLVGFVSVSSNGRLSYTIDGLLMGNKIIKQKRVDSLKKTRKDKIVISLFESNSGFGSPSSYYVCWDGLFFDKNSNGGAMLNLCEAYKKGSPWGSLNSWQARLMKSVAFHFPPREYSPSFDCINADTQVEKMICMNDDLSEQDATLAAKYQQITADSKTNRAQLATDQRAWLKQRNTCATVECLTDAYTRRIDELQAKPQSAQDKSAVVND